MPRLPLEQTYHQPHVPQLLKKDGSMRGNGYLFLISRQGIPLITGRFDPLEQLDEFSRSF